MSKPYEDGHVLKAVTKRNTDPQSPALKKGRRAKDSRLWNLDSRKNHITMITLRGVILMNVGFNQNSLQSRDIDAFFHHPHFVNLFGLRFLNGGILHGDETDEAITVQGILDQFY